MAPAQVPSGTTPGGTVAVAPAPVEQKTGAGTVLAIGAAALASLFLFKK
jgi:hypothetical protein